MGKNKWHKLENMGINLIMHHKVVIPLIQSNGLVRERGEGVLHVYGYPTDCVSFKFNFNSEAVSNVNVKLNVRHFECKNN